MITRLKTSRNSKILLDDLQKVLRTSTNAVILRLAISRSIKQDKPIKEDGDAVVGDTTGFEITRATLFGENEIVYKTAMGFTGNEDDSEFFPIATNMHIERGLKLLARDYKFCGNKEKFLKNIINKYC